jgi:hypothetical protein
MATGDVIIVLNFPNTGSIIFLVRKFPSLLNSIMAVSIKQIIRLITSTILSTITVPNKLLKGIDSTLLNVPQRVTSPNRGKARFAK